jgi:hypothetical protein
VRTKTVPWARPGARFPHDFEDVVASLAQRTNKTTITRLLRCSWEAVAAIVVRVVAAHLDDHRLDELSQIGVDEVAYRKGHRYLTVVADHDRDGAVVWVGEGKSGATLQRFFDQLGPDRTARLSPCRYNSGSTSATFGSCGTTAAGSPSGTGPAHPVTGSTRRSFDPRRLDRHRTSRGHHLAPVDVAVADDQPPTVLVRSAAWAAR